MKRCPTCNKTFTEEHLSFCVDDGTPLMTVSADDEATVVRSGPGDSSVESGFSGASGERDADAYQPPGSYLPPGLSREGKRRTWPWILGAVVIVAVIAVLGIAAVLLARNIGQRYDEAERRNRSAANANEANSNSNSASKSTNSNANDNNLNADDSTPPPTDEAEVLSELTDLENEWTAANINADKKKLDRILGDDYVETTQGRPRGKAEYLKTIQRDTAIEKWNFEDLKVNLKSDRATLSGTIRLNIRDDQGQVRPQAFVFTDKFVWRDGRWQATGSDVSPLKE